MKLLQTFTCKVSVGTCYFPWINLGLNCWLTRSIYTHAAKKLSACPGSCAILLFHWRVPGAPHPHRHLLWSGFTKLNPQNRHVVPDYDFNLHLANHKC